MTANALLKAGVLAFALLGLFAIGWESYLRAAGVPLSYDDDPGAWANERRRIYQSTPAGPVVIGSSRIKYALDLATWARLSGQRPVQLALTGTSPRPILTDLGNDPNFRGTLLVGVTEFLFFAPSAPGSPPERKAHERLKAYPKWSLAQQASFHLSQLLESRLLLLDEEHLTLDALLKHLPLPPRPGAFVFPPFAPDFSYDGPDRQSFMGPAFVASPAQHAQMQAAWLKLGAADAKPGAGGDTLRGILQSVKHSVDQIRSRGGRVVFVRCPSTGQFRASENRRFPRARYWNQLLTYTRTPGIYYADYPALAHYQCPEWSHLTPADAVTFTRDLLPIVQEKLSTSNDASLNEE